MVAAIQRGMDTKDSIAEFRWLLLVMSLLLPLITGSIYLGFLQQVNLFSLVRFFYIFIDFMFRRLYILMNFIVIFDAIQCFYTAYINWNKPFMKLN